MTRHETPGDGVLSPRYLGALTLLVFNDHVVKVWAPGFLSGKLSDVAGLVMFPLFLQAILEVLRAQIGTYTGPSKAELWFAVVSTAIAFSLVQLCPTANYAYAWSVGFIRWILTGGFDQPHAVRSWSDPWDLMTLPVLLVTAKLGAHRIKHLCI